MKKVMNGKFVKLDYTGKLENGDVFYTTNNTEPTEVEIGAGKVIKGFEDALLDMAENEKKTFTLSPEEGYGQRDESLEQSFKRSELPDNFQPNVGDVLALRTPQGSQIPGTVKHTDGEKITVDLNHPLAGQALTFHVEIKEINDEATQPVCSSGTCGGSCSTCS